MISVIRTAFLCAAAAMAASCGARLSLVETKRLDFTSFADDTVYLTEAGEVENRLYMIWGNGKISRSDISPLDWRPALSISCVIGPGAVSYDAVNNTLMRVKLVTQGVLDELQITQGNSSRRIGCPNESLNATSDYMAEIFMHRGARYVAWWDGDDLTLADLPGKEVVNERTVFTRSPPGGGVFGAFQPSATSLGDRLFILTQRGSDDARAMHLASSGDLTNWDNNMIEVEAPVAPRPQIVEFGGVLFIFYHSFIPDNEVRYIYSVDAGASWSDPVFLPADPAVEPTGRVGVVGGIGVARHFDTRDDTVRLAVAWPSDQDIPAPILISIYDLVRE